ncbi:Crotonobetainyl-CoA reductase [Streptomyces sp. enrichment culture]
MRFLLDAEQRAFAASLDALLTAADTPAVVREWSRGDHASGRALWSRLAEAGVFALAVPEAYEGLGPRPVDLAVAFVELGRHAVPGPLVETVTAAVLLTGSDPGTAKRLLPGLASGETVATVTPPGPAASVTEQPPGPTGTVPEQPPGLAETLPEQPPGPAGTVPEHPPGPTGTLPEQPPGPTETVPEQPPGPATVPEQPPGPAETLPEQPPGPATTLPEQPPEPTEAVPAQPPVGTRAPGLPQGSYALDGDAATLRLSWEPDGVRLSPGHGPARASLDPARRLTPLTPGGELLAAPSHAALSWARLATAAQALGVGLALLDRTADHVKRRHQFGVPVGSFQAVKHRLADAKIALEFARPLVFGAALTLDPADVAAAKVTACEAAYTTALTALRLHGAIGYTAEFDLSLWLTKARALRTAWGTPEECRALVVSAGDLRW